MKIATVTLSVLSIFSLALLIFWGDKSENSIPTGNAMVDFTPRPMPVAHPLEQDENWFYEIIFPETVLTGRTAEQFVSDNYIDSGFFFMDIKINAEGQVVIFYMHHQLLLTRNDYYTLGNLPEDETDVPSIVDVIRENELMSEITILVVDEYYRQDWQSNARFTANLLVATWVGRYQILSGVAPDDWHTTITVRCHETNDIISRNTFPTDDMFERSW